MELKGPGIRLAAPADIFTLILIPRSRHIEFTINTRIQLGKNGHVNLLVLITSRDVWEFLLAPMSPTWHCKLQKSLSAGKHSSKPTDVSRPR